MSKPAAEGKLLPDRLVAQRYDVHVRTLSRWEAIPGLGFPPPVYIRRRRYREIEKLDSGTRTTRAGLQTPTRRPDPPRQACASH